MKNKPEQYQSDENSLYEIIHDIKTPAAAELRVSEQLLKGSFGELNDLQKEVISQMNNNSKYMLEMINNISALCAYENDNIVVNFEEFDVNKIVKTCIADLQYLASEKRCSILFDFSENEIFLHASRIEITRVILNLISNAVKYSYSDRVIVVTTKKENNNFTFGVTSFGKILDENNKKDIFKKYTSLNKTGLGLGLYLCKIILEKYNCKIKINSDSKRGNYFEFTMKAIEKIAV